MYLKIKQYKENSGATLNYYMFKIVQCTDPHDESTEHDPLYYGGFTVNQGIKDYIKSKNITDNYKIYDDYTNKPLTLDPLPEQNQKSFYNKAYVKINEDGTEFLYSYGALILSISIGGTIKRHWDNWTQTTGRHIKAFCRYNKKQFLNLNMEK